MELFDRQAGNLTAIAGLGAQTATVGQEKIVQEATTRKIGQMQYRVMEGVTALIKNLGLLLWDDAAKQMIIEIPIEGMDFSATSVWEPGDREGNFLEYNFEIDVYSMQYQSPSGKAAKLTELVTQVFVPLAPLLQQQGGGIDMFKLAEKYAELLNMPELKECITFVGIPEEGPTPATDRIPKAPTSTRNYVRENVSRNGGQPSFGAGPMTAQPDAASAA